MEDWLKELSDEQDRVLKDIREGKCGCHRCIKERGQVAMHFVVCPLCGNKRCPKANDHDHVCTNSNEPGQHGSAYE